MKVAKIIATLIMGGILLCGYNTDLLAMEQDNTDYQTCYDPNTKINIFEKEGRYVICSDDNTINWEASLVNEEVFTSCNVFARKFPNTTDKTELCLTPETKVTRVGISPNGWDIITYDSNIYFIWSEYLIDEVPVVEEVAIGEIIADKGPTSSKKKTEKSIKGVIYDSVEIPYTETDITYMRRCVETETCGADFDSKTHVASVIINRVKNGKFGSSPYEVITSPSQFAYFRTSISQSTIDAVDYVIENGDTARGALFFHSNKTTATFCGRPLIFTDSCGHNFY